jgi:hypothetical protein
MSEETDKREHSAKPEKDDLTDYQSLNSLGGAGVAGTAKETLASDGSASDTSAPGDQKDSQPTNETEPSEVVKYSGDYNDGSDFSAVDNEAETNS